MCRKHQCWLHIRIHLQRLPNQAAMPLNTDPAKESFGHLGNCREWKQKAGFSSLLSTHRWFSFYPQIPKLKSSRKRESSTSLATHNNNTININKTNQLEKKQAEPKILFSLATNGFGEQYTIRKREEAACGGAQCKSVYLVYAKSWDLSPNR